MSFQYLFKCREKRAGLTKLICVSIVFFAGIIAGIFFGVKTKGSLNSLFSMFQKYWCCLLKKISLLDGRLDSCLLTDLGNSLKIVFGWLELFNCLVSCIAHNCYYIYLK